MEAPQGGDAVVFWLTTVLCAQHDCRGSDLILHDNDCDMAVLNPDW